MQRSRTVPTGHICHADWLFFSDRDLQVIRSLASGQRYKVIAPTLGLTEGSLRTYVYRIACFLGVSGGRELVAWIRHHHPAALEAPRRLEPHATGCPCLAILCLAMRVGLKIAAGVVLLARLDDSIFR